MCWHQGNWLFYLFYRSWQRKALNCARTIMRETRIDIIHQLNMVGFREPGFLWKIDSVPFVWGPVGGMEMMPMQFISDAGLEDRFFSFVKNGINRLQRKYSPRVRMAMKRADALISATKGCDDFIRSYYLKDTVLINETGCNAIAVDHVFADDDILDILWVGKFQFRKQLGLAIDSVAAVPEHLRKRIRLHVIGTGTPSEIEGYGDYSRNRGVDSIVVWHGVIPNEEVQELMRKSDLFLFTSIMEATSTVVIEAIGNGLPVLCFDTCGFGAVVDESVGMKIPVTVRDEAVSGFAGKIEYALMHPESLRQMSDGCKLKIEKLSWEWKTLETVRIYEKCLKNDKELLQD